jgi:hypothetical protein
MYGKDVDDAAFLRGQRARPLDLVGGEREEDFIARLYDQCHSMIVV